MTRSTAGRHRIARLAAVAGGLAAIVAAGALAGCGAGQVAATSIITSAVPGGSATVPVPNPGNPASAVYFTNVFIVPSGPGSYKVGSSAPLSVSIANQTVETVHVMPGRVFLINQTSGAVGEQIGTVGWSGGATPVTSPSEAPSSAPGSGSPPPTAAPTPSAPAAPDTHAVTLDPAGAVWLRPQDNAPNTPYLQIENLTQELAPGQTVQIEFTVAAGSTPVPNGPVRVVAPIGPADQTAARVTVAPAPTG